MQTVEISRKTLERFAWSLTADDDSIRSMVKCIVKDIGLYDEIQGFNKDRLVIQFGGESVRGSVNKCVHDNPIGTPTVDKSIQNVMKCLDELFRDRNIF